MEVMTQNKIDKFEREDVFLADNAADMKSGTRGGQLREEAAALTAQIRAAAAEQTAEDAESAQAYEQLETARQYLTEDLEQISFAARMLADEIDGIEDRFPRPRSMSDQNLLAKARAARADAEPYKAEFIEAELPADFLEDLTADLKLFEAARAAVSSAIEERSGARGELADLTRRRMDVSRKINAYIKIKYRDNPAKRAAWLVATHLERAPKPSVKPTQPA